MAKSRLDAIRGGLEEVWETQGAKFVSFEADGAGPDADLWVQYLDGELNVRWPTTDAPAPTLARRGVALPAGAFVAWWAPRENAVLGVGALRVEEVAQLVEDLLVRVVVGRADFELTVRVDFHR